MGFKSHAVQPFPLKVQHSIKQLWDYLRVSGPPKKSDAIFVFGEKNITPAQKAAQLYHQKIAHHIFFDSIGGTFRNFNWKESETAVYYRTLLGLGIPEDALHGLAKATNTLEEVRFAIPLMRKAGIEPKSIVIIALPVHQRRAWATMKKQYPRIEFINVPSGQPLIFNQATLDRIASEMARFKKYADKGDVLRQNFPKEIKKAWKTIIPYVKNLR